MLRPQDALADGQDGAMLHLSLRVIPLGLKVFGSFVAAIRI